MITVDDFSKHFYTFVIDSLHGSFRLVEICRNEPNVHATK